MNLKSYLNLHRLLQSDRTTREERRAFSLKHSELRDDPIRRLDTWLETHRHLIDQESAEHVEGYLYWITLILLVAAFVFGLFSGVALLSYSGKEPVNVIYFMAVVILMPILTMTLTLISLFRANRAKSTLIHLSPAYWMERIVAFFSQNAARYLQELKMSPLLANWIILRRSQWIALSFSIGLFVALIGVVVTRDIAFAWSTTLDIPPETFHRLLEQIALPWREWLPSAVPSLEMVTQSHYYRLGEKLSRSMLEHAALLGGWWKFLAMATLFYAIVLRIVMIVIVEYGYRRALRRSVLALEGADRLLKEMDEPLIRTHSSSEAVAPVHQSSQRIPSVTTLLPKYDAVIGWAIDEERLRVVADSFGITSSRYLQAGGMKSLEADKALIAQLPQGSDLLLVVKSWEPPTMDFIDFLNGLSQRAERITLLPIGTSKEGYLAERDDVNVWENKLASEGAQKVWIRR
jgi:hypothetical protein